MKQSIINVLVGSLFFTGMFLLYNLLFQDDIGVARLQTLLNFVHCAGEYYKLNQYFFVHYSKH